MSTENHDQPVAPEGSAAAAPEPERAAAQQPQQSQPPQQGAAQPATAQPAPPQPAQPAATLPQPVQSVSAPTAHPQAHETQELHPQQHATAPYPQQYGAPQPPQQPQQPQPRYGQYAPHPGHGPYGHPGQPPAAVPPHAPYPQQGPAQPGSGFANPYAASSSGAPGEPGEPRTTERAPRGWAPLITTAVITALLASGGTALAVTALQDDARPTSIAGIGDPGQVDTAPVTESTVTNPDWQAVTAAVSQSVVAIEMSSQQGSGLGSGLILDTDGHILTNNHVVAGATDDVVQVTLTDGRLFKADIVGTDPTTDLAVVKLQDPPSGLRPVALGNSDALTVGEPVLAVGNPLGLANTATTGIISALDRPVTASGDSSQEPVTTNAIQIDAAINPGNSGGPLFNAQGQVIGITSSIATLSGGGSLTGQSGSIGLGFAIPVNLAKNISGQLIEDGAAQHAFLGVSMTDGTATADGITRRGAQVRQVTAGSPAAGAGIQPGDVIVAIGDQPVSGASSLTGFVREQQAGQEVSLTVVRDGRALQLDVTLVVRDEPTQEPQPEQQLPQTPEGDQSEQGSSGGQGSLWDRLFGN
ncbi:2-alkenal reductase [Xylanimonas cellulosilytica DSM 15894]|uniref:2-alkenal reductase n=1 Tax=Xylanimonas cellulosilytica (strain DSM 15894 / JCM 12276 / CECT 5975 / KCTC 9989 / LMG 20990 / NBRC 107835 / XIL07) TaxID=446471 RepID=D1BVZ5_XYLCX|nr:trypsin-like peptidase domain-containing protein [Xylanimonas cellulosilytica]ACZ29498.1 2-alkenal reductase [Xylanimonas cellulosilytica DSM 15894]